jgi:hypothetical protein
MFLPIFDLSRSVMGGKKRVKPQNQAQAGQFP